MTDDSTPSVTERIADIETAVTDGVTGATARLDDASEEGRKPGGLTEHDQHTARCT
jgi:hypothetical protein